MSSKRKLEPIETTTKRKLSGPTIMPSASQHAYEAVQTFESSDQHPDAATEVPSTASTAAFNNENVAPFSDAITAVPAPSPTEPNTDSECPTPRFALAKFVIAERGQALYIHKVFASLAGTRIEMRSGDGWAVLRWEPLDRTAGLRSDEGQDGGQNGEQNTEHVTEQNQEQDMERSI